jgi:hypothetical protein
MQVDPAKVMDTASESFECVLQGIGMTSLSQTYGFGRFSLDARHANDHDRKASLNTVA